MTDKKIDITQLREDCLKNGLDFLTELRKLTRMAPEEQITQPQTTVTLPPPHPPVSLVKPKVASIPQVSKGNIIIDKLKELNQSETSPMSLERFVSLIKPSLAGIEFAYQCPLEDYVADNLFDYAKEELFDSIQTTQEAEFTRRIIQPDNKIEWKKVLSCFDDKAIEQILGRLEPGYIRKTYPLNKSFEFINEDGKIFNIGGTDNWDSENKKATRVVLLKHIKECLVDPITTREGSRRVITYRQLEEERDALEKKVDDFTKGRSENSLQYGVSCYDGGALNTFIKFFIPLAKDKHHITLDSHYSRKQNNAELTFSSKEDKDRFMKLLEEKRKEFRYLDRTRFDMTPLQTKEEIATIHRLKNVRDDLKKYSDKPVLRYLGLEGPNFRSYLQIFKLLKENEIGLNSYIPEYHHRKYNLMRGVIEAHSGAFNGVKVRQTSLDDLILLDFVEHPQLGLKDNRIVVFKGQEIPLVKYHELMRELKEKSSKELADKYAVSQELVRELSNNRYDGKFDIAYLDFNGPMSNKREKVLECLVKNRLSDNAIMAMTINTSSYVNRKLRRVKNIMDDVIGYFSNLTENEGYDVAMDFHAANYRGSEADMTFFSFPIKRKQITTKTKGE